MAGEIGGKSEASPAYNTQVSSHWPIPTIMQYEVYLKIDRESEIICSYQKFLNNYSEGEEESWKIDSVLSMII